MDTVLSNSRNVLVTGGAGYIGSHACKALAAAGFVPIPCKRGKTILSLGEPKSPFNDGGWSAACHELPPDINPTRNKPPDRRRDMTTLSDTIFAVHQRLMISSAILKRMTRPPPFTNDLKMAVRARAELLCELLIEAEVSGASHEIIDQDLTEELEAMRATLHEIYPPERVQAIVDELLGAYEAYRRSSALP
jgi:hypothetical protein